VSTCRPLEGRIARSSACLLPHRGRASDRQLRLTARDDAQRRHTIARNKPQRQIFPGKPRRRLDQLPPGPFSFQRDECRLVRLALQAVFEEVDERPLILRRLRDDELALELADGADGAAVVAPALGVDGFLDEIGDLVLRVTDAETGIVEIDHSAQILCRTAGKIGRPRGKPSHLLDHYLADICAPAGDQGTARIGRVNLAPEIRVRRRILVAIDPEQRQAVSTIRESGDNLQRLLNDILDLSKLETGRFQFEAIDFSPAALVDAVVAVIRTNAANKGLDLRVEIDPKLPPTLRGDAARIRQVLLNLASNAIKFTERGGVTIALVCHSRGDLLGAGVPGEDARFVFPNATRTNLVMTTNLRALIHMSGLRLCTMAQWEIRRLFQLIRHEIFGVSPFLGSFLAPKCVPLGYCDEFNNRDEHCPIRPHKDNVLAAWAQKRDEAKAAGRELPVQ